VEFDHSVFGSRWQS